MAATTLAVGMTSMTVSAISYIGCFCKTTSGGTEGSVTIRLRGFTDHYQPSGGINVYYFGVVADILINPSLRIPFNLSATFTSPSSSTSISESVTANSVKAYKTSSSPTAYNYCYSMLTTSSTAHGSASIECNCSFV